MRPDSWLVHWSRPSLIISISSISRCIGYQLSASKRSLLFLNLEALAQVRPTEQRCWSLSFDDRWHTTYASVYANIRQPILHEVAWFLRAFYTSLRSVGFACAATIPLCFQLSHDVLLCNWDTGNYSLVDDGEEEVDDPEKEEDWHYK